MNSKSNKIKNLRKNNNTFKGPVVKDKQVIKNKHQIKGTIKSIPVVFLLVLEASVKTMKLSYTIYEMAEQILDYHNKMIINHGVVDGTKRFNQTVYLSSV
jgi:hypothetical protein